MIEEIQVTKYKTEDGEVFENIEDAVLHDRYVDFMKWYIQKGHTIPDINSRMDENGKRKRRVDPKSVYEWLINNEGYLYHFLKNTGSEPQ